MRRRFKKKISQLMKRKEKYRNDIIQNREIKGIDISETTKNTIYSAIFISEDNSFEIGVIVLDNKYTTDKFIENHARTFNYMIQVYFNSCFRLHSRFKNVVEKMSLIIDEQNVATGAKYNLEGYLNQQLTIQKPLCDAFIVKYVDSKNEKLVQLADFIANTFYRNIEKRNRESIENVKILLPFLCSEDIFDFSETRDIRLNL